MPSKKQLTFMSQVQLLQRGQTDKSSAAPSMRVGDGVGFNDAMASGDGGGPGLAGDGRFADLLDARLGEERHMQVNWVACPLLWPAIGASFMAL